MDESEKCKFDQETHHTHHTKKPCLRVSESRASRLFNLTTRLVRFVVVGHAVVVQTNVITGQLKAELSELQPIYESKVAGNHTLCSLCHAFDLLSRTVGRPDLHLLGLKTKLFDLLNRRSAGSITNVFALCATVNSTAHDYP